MHTKHAVFVVDQLLRLGILHAGKHDGQRRESIRVAGHGAGRLGLAHGVAVGRHKDDNLEAAVEQKVPRSFVELRADAANGKIVAEWHQWGRLHREARVRRAHLYHTTRVHRVGEREEFAHPDAGTGRNQRRGVRHADLTPEECKCECHVVMVRIATVLGFWSYHQEGIDMSIHLLQRALKTRREILVSVGDGVDGGVPHEFLDTQLRLLDVGRGRDPRGEHNGAGWAVLRRQS